MIPLSSASLNAPPIRRSLTRELNALDRFRPSIGQVLSTFTEEVFQGEGSLAQDIRASEFEAVLDTDNALSEEDWKAGTNFRAGLKYHEGMTEKAATILAEAEDDRIRRNFVLSRATGGQKVLGFGSAFITGIAEPKNLASGIAAAVLTEGLGAVIPTVKRLFDMSERIGRYKALAARGGAEGALAAALTEPSNRESSKTLQGDYTTADTILNFALSTVLGAGLTVAPVALKAKFGNKKLIAEEFDTAVAQTVEGKKINVDTVEPITRVQEASAARAKIKRLDSEIDTLPSVIPEQPISELFYNNRIPEDIEREDILNLAILLNNQPQKPQTLLAFLRDSGGLIDQNGELSTIGITSRTRPGFINNKGLNFDDATLKAWEAGFFPQHTSRPEIDDLLTAIRDDFDGQRLVIREQDFDYFDRLSTFNKALEEADRLGVNIANLKTFGKKQKLKSQVAFANSRINTAPDSIEFKQDEGIGFEDSKETQAFLDDFEDNIENTITDLEQELRVMEQNDVLDSDDLVTLKNIEEIDRELAAFDNTLDNAFSCLTRE
jgi:hypothetical protein